MKQRHFEQLRPVCPACRPRKTEPAPLEIAHIDQRLDEATILTGILRCSAPDCCSEFPIIDGLPIILANVREYVASQVLPVLRRHDLPESIESLIGDCCGPGHELDATRCHLSSYAWDHYGDLLDLNLIQPESAPPGSVRRVLREGRELLGEWQSDSPVLDMGCSVGRTTFDLAAEGDGLALGIDVNFSMLQVAARVLHEQVAAFPLRENGLVFHQQRAKAALPHSDRVDFWLCDGSCLPLHDGTFGLVSQLNTLDSTTSPHALLSETARVLAVGGKAMIGCPYDWAGSVTPVEGWLGGHSQRGPLSGKPENLLDSLLDPTQPHAIAGLRKIGEKLRTPWHVRIHSRSAALYDVHLVAAEKTA